MQEQFQVGVQFCHIILNCLSLLPCQQVRNGIPVMHPLSLLLESVCDFVKSTGRYRGTILILLTVRFEKMVMWIDYFSFPAFRSLLLYYCGFGLPSLFSLTCWIYWKAQRRFWGRIGRSGPRSDCRRELWPWTSSSNSSAGTACRRWWNSPTGSTYQSQTWRWSETRWSCLADAASWRPVWCRWTPKEDCTPERWPFQSLV